MIKKYRQEPMQIKQLNAIIRRLPPNHSSLEKVKQVLAIVQAGYRGEQMVDYYLEFLPKKTYTIYQHLRLQSASTYYFQMDTVIVSPNIIFILEVKNIAGTLYFDDHFKQCIRTDLDGKEEGFLNPIYQTERQRSQLVNWLKIKKISDDIPVYPLIVIAQPSTIIKSSSPHLAQKVIHAATIPTMIKKIHDQHTKEYLDDKQLRKLNRIFLKEHTELTTNYLVQLKIDKEDFIPGVQCPQCKNYPMRRHLGKWFCETCECHSQDAHLQALIDFRLLFNTTITNKQLRNFLQISTTYEASRILKELQFPFTGYKKNRTYEIPFQILK